MLLNYTASLRLSSVQWRFIHKPGIDLKKGSRVYPVIGLHCRGPGGGNLDEATDLKQFPYMELLDSTCPEQEYCVRSIFLMWREARSMLILKTGSTHLNGADK
jgi:hypothetical protein